MTENRKLDRLKELLAEVDDLRKAATLLFWDQRVMMPAGGAEARADASATVGRLSHEKFVSKEIGALLDELNEDDYDYDSFEASLIRVTRRDYDKAVRVPPELTGEMRRSSALALAAWGPAKANSDFSALLPHLERNLELRHQYVECFDPADETYDILLDDLSSLFASMHEFGHGVYEWGVDPMLHRTPLGSGVSLGVHESQSRTWENLVGRSRAFWRFFYPQLQEVFPAQLDSVDEEAFYRAVNKVHPSLIRIDADEVTYNMHIILRF